MTELAGHQHVDVLAGTEESHYDKAVLIYNNANQLFSHQKNYVLI